MKILQVGPYPPPLGGWSFHIKKFQDYLIKEAVENDVLNIGESRKKSVGGCVSVTSFPDYVKKHIFFLQRGYTVYNHVDGCSWKGFILTITSQFLSLAFGRRAFLSFHAGLDQHCFDKNRPLYRLLGFVTFFLAGKIICNSVEVKEAICWFHKPHGDVFPIPCFSSQYLHYEKRLTKEQKSFIERHDVLLFSYLFFRDGFMIEDLVKTLQEIVKKTPGIGVILVGSTAGGGQHLEMVQRAGLGEHLLLAGDVDHHTFLSLLSESDLYVRTHLNDGVCSSVMEALALGVPVVASYNSMRPEQVVTFERNNGEDLLQKVIWAVEQRDVLRQKVKLVAQDTGDNLLREYEVLSHGNE